MKTHRLKGKQLADILGVHQNTITAWKREGAPKMAAMALMAYLMGWTPSSSDEIAAYKAKTRSARGL